MNAENEAQEPQSTTEEVDRGNNDEQVIDLEADEFLDDLEEGIQAEKDLVQQLEEMSQKARENWDKLLRVQAEMDNLRRRTEIELQNAHKFAVENFAKELLPVIDSLELGLQSATADTPEVAKLVEGSELTLKQFKSAFDKFNIVAVDPAGEPFDPGLHQAMAMQPTNDAKPNTVLTVFQKGYSLNDRLLRPAMVVVAQAIANDETPHIDEQA